MMTAIAEKMRKAGVERWHVEMDKALALAMNQGATYAMVMARVRAAYELPGEGHRVFADEGQDRGANARQANGDGAGHRIVAVQGQIGSACPSPQHREREGQRRRAHRAIQDVPAPREPSKAQRNAAIEARKASAKAVLDLGWLGEATIPAGPRYVDLRVGDLPGMIERQLSEGATHARSAIALRLIQREVDAVGVADPTMRWVDVLPSERVKEIAQATEVKTLKPLAMGWLRNLNETAGSMIEGGRVDA